MVAAVRADGVCGFARLAATSHDARDDDKKSLKQFRRQFESKLTTRQSSKRTWTSVTPNMMFSRESSHTRRSARKPPAKLTREEREQLAADLG